MGTHLGPIDILAWKWEVRASVKIQGSGTELAGVFKATEFTLPSGVSINYDGSKISTVAGQIKNGPNTLFNRVGLAITPIGEIQADQFSNSSTSYVVNGVSLTQKFSVDTRVTNRGIPLMGILAAAYVAKPLVPPVAFWLAQRPQLAR